MATVEIPCVCPVPNGHTTDTITLRETVPFRDAVAMRNDAAIVQIENPEATPGDLIAALTESYILRGVEAWTLRDEKGKPIPVSRTAITEHLLSHLEEADIVAEAADELYGEKVVLPLVRRAFGSSPRTPTASSTSATTSSSAKSPRRSSRSSTSTTPTDATGTTS